MNDRERIFSSLRDGQPGVEDRVPRPALPEILPPPDAATPILDRFILRLEEAGGEAVRGWPALADRLHALDVHRGVVDPVFLPEARGALEDFTLLTAYDREQADKIEFSITRAAGAIAETGSLVLASDTTPHRLAALTPWIHVAVLEPRTLVESTTEAVRQFDADRSVLWVTGPSKTADIEGVLVRGVHGPGIQLCLLHDPR